MPENSRILVVDDNQTNIYVVETLLKKTGYQVYSATSGKEALETASQILPNLILLDVMMPGMDGFETLLNLRKNGKTKDIPVIFVTADNDTKTMTKGLEMGAVDFITKPFNSIEFRTRIKAQLELQLRSGIIIHQNQELRNLFDKLQTTVDKTGKVTLDLVREIDESGDAMSRELILQKLKINIIEMLVAAGNDQLNDDLERLKAGTRSGEINAQDQQGVDNLLSQFGM